MASDVPQLRDAVPMKSYIGLFFYLNTELFNITLNSF